MPYTNLRPYLAWLTWSGQNKFIYKGNTWIQYFSLSILGAIVWEFSIKFNQLAMEAVIILKEVHCPKVSWLCYMVVYIIWSNLLRKSTKFCLIYIITKHVSKASTMKLQKIQFLSYIYLPYAIWFFMKFEWYIMEHKDAGENWM